MFQEVAFFLNVLTELLSRTSEVRQILCRRKQVKYDVAPNEKAVQAHRKGKNES